MSVHSALSLLGRVWQLLTKISDSSEQQSSCRKLFPAWPLSTARNSRVFDEIKIFIYFYVHGSMFSFLIFSRETTHGTSSIGLWQKIEPKMVLMAKLDGRRRKPNEQVKISTCLQENTWICAITAIKLSAYEFESLFLVLQIAHCREMFLTPPRRLHGPLSLILRLTLFTPNHPVSAFDQCLKILTPKFKFLY